MKIELQMVVEGFRRGDDDKTMRVWLVPGEGEKRFRKSGPYNGFEMDVPMEPGTGVYLGERVRLIAEFSE